MRKDFYVTNVKNLVIVAPEEFFLKKVIDALNLIKKTEPEEYENLFTRIICIFVTRMNSYMNSFFPVEKIWFVNKPIIKSSNLIQLAALILHEGFHSTQFKNGRWTSSEEVIEKAANEFQIKFLKKFGDQETIDFIRREVKNEYWFEMDLETTANTYYENLLKLCKIKGLKLTYINKEKAAD